MQLISNVFSKLLALAVLSCGFLVAWDYFTTQFESPKDNAKESSLARPRPTLTHLNPPDAIYIEPQSNLAELSAMTQAESTDSIWLSISKALTLDHKANSSQVRAQIRSLLADRSELNRILSQATPYLYFIYYQTQARGLPAELALIPFIESEFNPNDHSNKGATGLWQLMPGTAQELGIKVRSGYDGRKDVIASTKAALAYFNDLGNYFKGNWYLAIAAYNCGQGTIHSAMRHAGSRNFWDLRVPRETKVYVPRLLAVAAIVKDHEKYGVKLPHVNNEPYFTELKSSRPVSIQKVARKAGINLKTLKKLNPDYNHGIVAKKGAYTLLVPVNKASQAKAHLI